MGSHQNNLHQIPQQQKSLLASKNGIITNIMNLQLKKCKKRLKFQETSLMHETKNNLQRSYILREKLGYAAV